MKDMPNLKQSIMTSTQHARLPRLVIAGEFSAGKTRLLNALLGQNVLPSNVTSTSLPPMWLTKREGTAALQNMDGEWEEMGALADIVIKSTKFCVLPVNAPILKHFDLIDTPGNSDPNIPSESWERMIGYADLVIWCSNANQAWRQSEKAVWSEMPDRLKKHSAIVLTHADQIPDERSKSKIMRRVKREAAEFFCSFDLLSSLSSEQVEDFAARLIESVSELPHLTGSDDKALESMPFWTSSVDLKLVTTEPVTAPPARKVNVVSAEVEAVKTEVKPAATDENAISPRRIRAERRKSKHSRRNTDASSVNLVRENKVQTPEAMLASKLAESNKAGPASAVAALTSAKASVPQFDERFKQAGAGRLAWARLSKDIDMSNPSEILACVEALIQEMDTPDNSAVFAGVGGMQMRR